MLEWPGYFFFKTSLDKKEVKTISTQFFTHNLC